jgi:sugar O-acyltransferase (sialic acid O-acetyltransferase NeuD family)
MKNKTRIAIIGSGDLGQLIAHHAEYSCNFEIIGFFDDFKSKRNLVVNKYVLLGNTTSDVFCSFENGEFDKVIIGIGYKHMSIREEKYVNFAGKIPFANVIHPSCVIDKSCKIGEGNFILPSCTLDKGVRIGNNVLLNTGVTIAHDSFIDDHTFLAPGVTLAGFINIGKRCFLGIGTIVINNINITCDVQTGGGALVVRNLIEKGLYLGTPAKQKL